LNSLRLSRSAWWSRIRFVFVWLSMSDDPVARDSRQSYFLQLADLSAYAAFRRLYPPPARPVQIVPQTMWDEIGAARFSRVRSLKYGDPAGIVPGP